MALTGELVDDFNDNSLDTGKWLSQPLGAVPGFANIATSIGGSVAETGGKAALTGATSTAGACDGYYSQDAALDMTSSEIVIDLDGMFVGGGTDVSFVLGGDQGSAQYYRTVVTNSFSTLTIQFRSNNFGDAGADQGGTVSITYSATDHRWLRIRHDTAASGTIYWDTAPDDGGVPGTWTNRRTLTSASSGYFAPTSLQVGFVVVQNNSETAPETITCDNFNVIAASGPARPVVFAGLRQRMNN